MNNIKKLLALGLLSIACIANANTYTFIGNLVNYNDVVKVNFSLAQAAANVRIWTDSFMEGNSFDPIVGLWNATTGAKLMENDDNDTIALGQTSLDSGFMLSSLGAGDYVFTIAGYPNFSNGDNLSGGFSLDSSDSVPIPSSKRAYKLNIEDVEQEAELKPPSSVPLPGTLWLFGTALFGFVGFSSRRSI